MRFLLVLVPIFLAAPMARAANTESKEREARTACLAGDPAKGVQLLSELFVEKKDPNFIFNSGRCEEQSLNWRAASAKFQEYLRVAKKLSKAEKADAEKHIADCEALLAKEKRDAVTAPTPAPPPAPEAMAPAPAAAVDPPVVQQTNPQPSNGSGSGLRTAGVVTASVGVAALVTGIFLNLKANSMASDLENAGNFNRDTDTSRKSYKTLAWVSYGAGAACLAGGSLLYYLGWRAGNGSESAVAFVPTFAPDMAGAALKGAF